MPEKYIDELNYAMLDSSREERTGLPEVIYCSGKTPEQVAGIAEAILKKESFLLASRASREVYEALRAVAPEAVYYEQARTAAVGRWKAPRQDRLIAVVTAGTSDVAIAEEAAVTAELLGRRVNRIYDVGVAGLHRLFARLPEIREAHVVIVVAGMEGALASVVGGLVKAPVIAVPTSIGYGANFGGLAALLSMLNSCAGGVSVVNIDSGFNAACMAVKISGIE
ncbi:MAG: nickel pincer cofactor biosynthesis protein LarB [Bacillota bacterium]|nr:nickel pincer cofactor biosynthesis protein LarB [Bacillota bacterium]